MDSDFFNSLMSVLVPVATSGLIALIGFGANYLKIRMSVIKNETVRKALEAALVEAARVATDAAKATKQVLVDDLKAKSEDGKLTKEEAAEALNKAKDYFMSHITKESMSIIKAAFSPFDDWLEQLLEAKVYDAKIPSVLDPLL